MRRVGDFLQPGLPGRRRRRRQGRGAPESGNNNNKQELGPKRKIRERGGGNLVAPHSVPMWP